MTGSSSGMLRGLVDLAGTDVFHDSMALICWLPRYGCAVADVELDELVVDVMLEALRLEFLLLCAMLLSVVAVFEQLFPVAEADMLYSRLQLSNTNV